MAPKSNPQLLMAVAILFIHLRPCTFLDPTRNSPGRGAGSGQGRCSWWRYGVDVTVGTQPRGCRRPG